MLWRRISLRDDGRAGERERAGQTAAGECFLVFSAVAVYPHACQPLDFLASSLSWFSIFLFSSLSHYFRMSHLSILPLF